MLDDRKPMVIAFETVDLEGNVEKYYLVGDTVVSEKDYKRVYGGS
jgi:hypothetical protein